MRRQLSALVLAATLAASCSAKNPLPATEPATQEQLDPGKVLAEQLRSSQPNENSEIRGVLKIYAGKTHREIPVVCQVVIEGATWKTIYQTSPTPQTGAEKLVIIHSANGPNKYLYAHAPTPAAPLPELKPLHAKEILASFAGSDFSIADLGLDFLHWPQQRRLPGELRLGQDCYLLESSDPPAPEIVRVKSWIDKESGGLLVAEAFDRTHHEVKEFNLSGSSFKKVNGKYLLEQMKISRPKNNSHTILKFDLPKQ